jgi:hypothetical protein
MPVDEQEMLKLMRENAALCNLEAEVIMALKANAVGDTDMVEKEITQVMLCLQRIDDVRKRYNT